MSSQDRKCLLANPLPGHHFCQLHADPHVLHRSVARFASAGLGAGAAVVLAAGRARRAVALQCLDAMGHDCGGLQARGQFTVLDAEMLLGVLMRDGRLSWERFRDEIGSLLDSIEQRGFERVRIYGELVNCLWQRNQAGAAIELEQYWNRLQQSRRFALFCGYEIDGFDAQTYGRPICRIADMHGQLLEHEDDERFAAAVNSASCDVFGAPLSSALGSGEHRQRGEQRLPCGYRTLIWLQRNMPSTMVRVLRRARHYYEAPAPGY